jgi:lipopolysaccharide/colanic/teichoic acid biosynthesis glycosyltransferase
MSVNDMNVRGGPSDRSLGSPPKEELHGNSRWNGEKRLVKFASGLPSFWASANEPIPVAPSALRSFRLAIKRVVDIILSSAALVFLAPLLITVVAAIKISDPGPALFKQEREGRGRKPFTIYKFRSMYLAKCCADGTVQTTFEDARVMPVGAFLRRTSIDELPQLLNVLKGDMSLVGPRPHVGGQLAGGLPYDSAVNYYDYRYAMRPGLTGWAQANGYRGPTNDSMLARQRVDHDVAYIQNASPVLDAKIILVTLRRELMGGSGF